MKVNQIIGEHKKGFRAKKYTAKPKNAVEPIKPKKPEATSSALNENLQRAFDSWMNSEYAPYDDDSGDYNEVFRKALHFAADHLHNRSDSEHLAGQLTNIFHGEDPDLDLGEDDGQQAGYTVKSTNPTTGEITVAPNVSPTEIKPGSTINLDAPDQAMEETEEDVLPNEQSYDDQQMEAIKKLAGL